METETSSFVAECFWPDVREQDVRALDERILACLGPGGPVRYLGSILIREDEVVLCQFAGPAAAAAGDGAEAADGTGAAFAVESWGPDNASRYVRKWNTRGFTALTLSAARGAVFGDLPAFQPLNLKPLVSQGRAAGADRAAGLTATPFGVSAIRAAAGPW